MVPPAVFAKLFDHPLTDAGIRRFMEDWAAYRNKENPDALRNNEAKEQ